MDAIRYHLHGPKTMKLLLFYAGMLYGEFASWPRKHEIPEVYDGGWLYCAKGDKWGGYLAGRWYRCDGCPSLIDDVPKELRLQVLLLT